MTIRKFTAKSTAEALTLVRQELGEDAVILHTRRVPATNAFGIPGGMIEVTAGLPDEEDRGQPNEGQRRIASWNQSSAVSSSEIAELRRELEALRETVRWLTLSEEPVTARKTGLWSRRLVQAGLDPDLVQVIAQELGPESDARKAWSRALAERIPTSGGIGSSGVGPYVVVLVGPTGVGKTTTLAKLAAQKKIFEDRRVAFITADTYRIAAIEQLRTFAEIADIPIEVVYSPAEVSQALRRFRYLDYIFVDTAGRSQRNEEHLADLVSLLEQLQPDEVHLVLSLTSERRVLEEVIDRFRCASVTHFLFTKVDECNNWVQIANLSCKYGTPVSYITNGQCVPEDIMVAEAMDIAERALPEEL